MNSKTIFLPHVLQTVITMMQVIEAHMENCAELQEVEPLNEQLAEKVSQMEAEVEELSTKIKRYREEIPALMYKHWKLL